MQPSIPDTGPQEPDRASTETAYDVGLRLIDRHGQEELRPRRFDMLGLTWDLLPGVFAPVYTASTELFSRWMPYPLGGRFLEVGCGAGVTAVTAALRGARRVTALDVAPAAVRNTAMNAARHGVGDRVRVLTSDLFDALDADEEFDVIFWNSNVVLAPEDFTYTSDVQRAILDRGYRAHRRYLREGTARLAEGGRLLLGFNSLGDRGRLEDLAHEADRRISELRGATRTAGGVPTTFQLLDIAAAPS
jgi:release factor glutamine methyltransferase